MKNNCTNPPHFPPHCGCPAGFTDSLTTPILEPPPAPRPEGDD